MMNEILARATVQSVSDISSTEGVIAEILAVNEKTAQYGLVLDKNDAAEIAEARTSALRVSGRLEFHGGLIEKLIEAFCDSPYIDQTNYKDTICELLYLFYEYKSLTRISDKALIKYMADSFNGECRGSIEMLNSEYLMKSNRTNER